jgi:hypothetical protein
MYNLALFYLEGWGVGQNMDRAMELLNAAAAQGYVGAIELLKKPRLTERLPSKPATSVLYVNAHGRAGVLFITPRYMPSRVSDDIVCRGKQYPHDDVADPSHDVVSSIHHLTLAHDGSPDAAKPRVRVTGIARPGRTHLNGEFGSRVAFIRDTGCVLVRLDCGNGRPFVFNTKVEAVYIYAIY